MLNETLLAALGEILPPSALLTAGEDTRPYECDGLTLFRAQPLAVLLPENEAQVVEILKICHAARSVAMSPRIPAACTVSSTGSPCITSVACEQCLSVARLWNSAAMRSIAPVTICSH